MIRKNVITLSLIIACIGAHAQTYTAKNLIGRWQANGAKNVNMVFTSDTTGAWLNENGLIWMRFKYDTPKPVTAGRPLNFHFIIDLDARRRRHTYSSIKFLNDSVFLIRLGWFMPKGTDTGNQKVMIYTKIKHPAISKAPRLPDYRDLTGRWTTYSKNSGITSGLEFIDSTHIIRLVGDKRTMLTYKADFTKQPIIVDLYNDSKIAEAFMALMSDNELMVETFAPGERPDHFTVFGQNTHLTRQKSETGAGSAGN
jgi:hypothetical protein